MFSYFSCLEGSNCRSSGASWWLLTHPKIATLKIREFWLKKSLCIQVIYSDILGFHSPLPKLKSSVAPTSTWRPAVAKGVAHPQNVLQVDHYQVCLSHNNPMLKKKNASHCHFPHLLASRKKKHESPRCKGLETSAKWRNNWNHILSKLMTGGLRRGSCTTS